MRILVTGSNGQLGKCLKAINMNFPLLNFVFLDSLECNISDFSSLEKQVALVKPDYIINCAAYTAVDLAEANEKLAYEVNCIGVGNLVLLCRERDITLIHISTDFVFDGEKVKLLTEEDETNPVNQYGLTKLVGEKAISEVLEKHIIIRTSWLYSEFGNNFLKTILRLGAERDSLNIVADQIGTPTYAVDLAKAICKIIMHDQKDYGVFHYSNEGVASWFDFAQMICSMSNLPVKINAITTSEYPTAAKRPSCSVLNKNKIKTSYNLEIDHWIDGLKRCLTAISK